MKYERVAWAGLKKHVVECDSTWERPREIDDRDEDIINWLENLKGDVDSWNPDYIEGFETALELAIHQVKCEPIPDYSSLEDAGFRFRSD